MFTPGQNSESDRPTRKAIAFQSIESNESDIELPKTNKELDLNELQKPTKETKDAISTQPMDFDCESDDESTQNIRGTLVLPVQEKTDEVRRVVQSTIQSVTEMRPVTPTRTTGAYTPRVVHTPIRSATAGPVVGISTHVGTMSRGASGYEERRVLNMSTKKLLMSEAKRPDENCPKGKESDESKDCRWDTSLKSSVQLFNLLIDLTTNRCNGYLPMWVDTNAPKPVTLQQVWEIYKQLAGESAAACFQSALRYFDYYSEVCVQSGPVPQTIDGSVSPGPTTSPGPMSATPGGLSTSMTMKSNFNTQVLMTARGFRQFAEDCGLCEPEEWCRHARAFAIFTEPFEMCPPTGPVRMDGTPRACAEKENDGSDMNERTLYWQQFGLSCAAFALGVIMASPLGKVNHIAGSPTFNIRMRYIFEYFGFREGVDPESALNELLEACPGSNALTARYNLDTHVRTLTRCLQAREPKSHVQAYLSNLFSQLVALTKSRFICSTEQLFLFKKSTGGCCILDPFIPPNPSPIASALSNSMIFPLTTTGGITTSGITGISTNISGGIIGTPSAVNRTNLTTSTSKVVLTPSQYYTTVGCTPQVIRSTTPIRTATPTGAIPINTLGSVRSVTPVRQWGTPVQVSLVSSNRHIPLAPELTNSVNKIN